MTEGKFHFGRGCWFARKCVYWKHAYGRESVKHDMFSFIERTWAFYI